MGLRILVVDDAIFFRRLVRSRLDAEDGFDVVAEARDGKEAVRLAAQYQPDVIVMDGSMPLMDGVEALPLIKDVSPASRVVFMSTDRETRRRALQAGADAAISKDDSLSICVEEIVVLQGGRERSHTAV